MKKLIILSLGICFLQLSCKDQSNNSSALKNYIETNNQVIKTLGEKRILIYKSHNKWEYVTNDTLFSLKESEHDYIETAKSIYDNFHKSLDYDKKTLRIKREGMYFDKIPIGIHKFYSINGHILKINDYDENFRFTIYDLITKVKTDLKVDLNKDLKGIEVRRGKSSVFNIPEYYISIPIKTLTSRQIIIDGTFGFIISDKIEEVSIDD